MSTTVPAPFVGPEGSSNFEAQEPFIQQKMLLTYPFGNLYGRSHLLVISRMELLRKV
jgi:hypothetical protein